MTYLLPGLIIFFAILNLTSAFGSQCEVYDYTSVDGAKKVLFLQEGFIITRKLISSDKSELVSQKVQCTNGKLQAVLTPAVTKGKCLYYDYQNISGGKTDNYLEHGKFITRSIVTFRDRKPFLIKQNIGCKNSQLFQNSLFDEYGRLTQIIGKTETRCPTQNKETAVILTIGQSNSANHAIKRYKTRYPKNVLNYYDGKCYVASSPLLGATGDGGEFLTLMADNLISSKKFNTIILISSGIAGTEMSRWQYGADLNNMLLNTLKPIKEKFKVSHVVWHQGESDFAISTTTSEYTSKFRSLLKSLSDIGISAPVFTSVATKCAMATNLTWKKDNPTALAQSQLIDNKRVFLGADTDALLTVHDRQSDGCHLSPSGQEKTALQYAKAILSQK